ncbi:hypothetical protein PHYBLDRAFT_140928 [Phycomyces blakesleeanus NRRL 1555(-)]|uniref:Uncharacterized protein n=1 Tax=Phycomyces blakesleeanus (strain ATCC 8743b / DSM 1359 / FGSC 10004 / NBRC 33097 / NRRL 1555) TaxID=763407 RepID=A0A167Q0R8_PHYB8|nr:hypothetical protein PHYBLDRAFT_140928 [Phycomyces blakesleeanus NRRL 1555(-)]OAD78874.1 hypothetical protein PHYBLDRAFT_140928 [Phycomyces blakesleeanus NRRL 1555(-)]|eukprot:XP_018296914.1 hypothetical protein PHYBLDRAFT_140928 [Phycomyces blakesleeanus NRRL 1555(-)]
MINVTNTTQDASIHPPPPISPNLLIDGPDGVDPRVKHGLSSKSTSARVACEPVVRIPVYYWLLSVVSSGGRGWYHLFWSVASASGTFLPVGLLLPTGRPFPPTSGPVISRQWTFSYSRRLPVAGCQLPAACFTSTGGSIYLTGRRHLSHWSDICFLLLPVASAGEPDGSISAAKLSAMLCPQDTSSKADKAHQKPNMGACKKATSAHKRGQSMRQSKDQSGPQERPMLQVRTRERANQPTRKAKDKPVRKKGQSRRQSKHQSGLQERLIRGAFLSKSKIWVVPPSLKAKSISKKGSNANPPLQKDQKKSELEAYTKSSTPKGSNPKTEA